MRNKTVIPTAAIGDHRLTGRDIRVLAAICHQDGDAAGHVISPARSDLAVMLASNESNISRSLSRLCHAGWLTRRHVGRKGHPSRYTINWTHRPDKVSKTDTLSPENKVSENDTLPDKVSKTDTLKNKVSENDTLSGGDKVSENDTLPDKVSKTDTLSGVNGNKVSQIGTPDHDDDLDQYTDHHHGDLTTQAVHDLLTSHHINGVASAHARNLINAWIERGVTHELLQRAINRSLQHCRNGKPGVPYIDRAIQSLLDDAKHKVNSPPHDDDFHSSEDGEIPWQANPSR